MTMLRAHFMQQWFNLSDPATQEAFFDTPVFREFAQLAAPTSTKNKDRARDPEMHSSKKGNQWYFGTMAHIGADTESGLVPTVRGTSGHVSDTAEANTKTTRLMP